MKFTKSDFPKMVIAALIPVLIFLAWDYFSERRTYYDDEKSTSRRITWDSAILLKKEYVDFKPLLLKFKTRREKDTIAPLEGFRFNARQLDEIINRNKSKNFGDSADEVAFYLGQQNKFGGLRKHGNIHIIAVGVKHDSLMIDKDENKRPSQSVYDHANPIPPNPGR